MTPTRPLPRRLAVTGSLTGGLLAGLAVTAPLLAVAEPAAAPPAGPVTVTAHAAAAPRAVTALRPPVRASRSARTAAPPRTVLRTVPVGRSFDGLASWYGGSFHGRRTASGEVFDAEGLSAASRTLPFGTRLRVCRAERCVVVRVNDRGPFHSHRVLDLSRGASRALGFSGVARVTATPIGERRVLAAARRPAARPVVRHVRSLLPSAPPGLPTSLPQATRATGGARDEAASLGVLAAGLIGTSGAGLTGGRTRQVDPREDLRS